VVPKLVPPYFSFKAFDTSTAPCVSEARTRDSNQHTGQVEGAAAIAADGAKAFNWHSKIVVQLHVQEVYLALALFETKSRSSNSMAMPITMTSRSILSNGRRLKATWSSPETMTANRGQRSRSCQVKVTFARAGTDVNRSGGHTLRNTFAAQTLKRGGTKDDVKKYLGLALERSAEIYETAKPRKKKSDEAV